MSNQEQLMTEYEIELIKHLRKEAFDVKHCFTQYSFQALALVTAILGIALKFYEENEFIGLVGVPLTLLLVTIASIGTHKYSTANRLLGYELHLQRAARYPRTGAPGWQPYMRDLGWEEALRAWRVFQATVFEYLYIRGNLASTNPNLNWLERMRGKIFRILKFWSIERLKDNLMTSAGLPVLIPNERWFETRSHLSTGMSYHPGGYLQTMLNIIYFTAFICICFSLHVTYRLYFQKEYLRMFSVIVVVGLFAYWSFARFMHCYQRRKVLEEGLLSINSCAVLWQAVAAAHYLTLEKLSFETDGIFKTYKNYSKTLGSIAIQFCDEIFDLYGWYDRNTPKPISTPPPKPS